MARVVLDADVVIAFIDRNDAQHERAWQALETVIVPGGERFMASSAYAEILVQPIRNGSANIVDDFVDAFGLRIVPLDRDIARRAAHLRSEFTALKLPDALGIATAQALQADFLTLDKRLQRILEQMSRPE